MRDEGRGGIYIYIYIHHGPSDVGDRNDAFLLAVHGLREEAEGLADVGLLLRRDVVLLGELGLSRLGRAAAGRRRRLGWRSTAGWLEKENMYKLAADVVRDRKVCFFLGWFLSRS